MRKKKEKPKSDDNKENETTNPDTTENITFTDDSKLINENTNKWNTVWKSIDNWVYQEQEITINTEATKKIIDNATWNTIIKKPIINNTNINTWVKPWDIINTSIFNPLSNTESTKTFAEKTSKWDKSNKSNF